MPGMTLLLALALAVQESPEAAFRKIEANIERAKNIRVLFTVAAASDSESTSRGTVTIEGESKLKLNADLKSKGGGRLAIFTEFENKVVKSSFAGRTVQAKAEGRQVRQNFNAYLGRLGILTGAIFEYGFYTGTGGQNELAVDMKQLFQLTNMSFVGDGPDGTKIITYDFQSAIKPIPFLWAKVWYDPKTYRLVRREERWEYKGVQETIIENYEFQFDDEKTGVAKATPTPAATAASEAEQDVLFIQAKIQVANEHLTNGRKQKAVDVLEDLALSFPKHALYPEIKRLLEQAKNK